MFAVVDGDEAEVFDDYADALHLWREATSQIVHVMTIRDDGFTGHDVGGCPACRDADLYAQLIGV